MLEVFLRFDPTKHDIQNLNAVDMRGHFEKKSSSTPQIAQFKQNVRTLPWGLIVNKKLHFSRRTLPSATEHGQRQQIAPAA